METVRWTDNGKFYVYVSMSLFLLIFYSILVVKSNEKYKNKIKDTAGKNSMRDSTRAISWIKNCPFVWLYANNDVAVATRIIQHSLKNNISTVLWLFCICFGCFFLMVDAGVFLFYHDSCCCFHFSLHFVSHSFVPSEIPVSESLPLKKNGKKKEKKIAHTEMMKIKMLQNGSNDQKLKRKKERIKWKYSDKERKNIQQSYYF